MLAQIKDLGLEGFGILKAYVYTSVNLPVCKSQSLLSCLSPIGALWEKKSKNCSPLFPDGRLGPQSDEVTFINSTHIY